ncbi:MAG: Glucose-6-phosphate dehydrogenase (coenzyme F420), partial [uncultured Solirubrobacteraceae bacterium]
ERRVRLEGFCRAVRPAGAARALRLGRGARLRDRGGLRPLPALAPHGRPRPERADVARGDRAGLHGPHAGHERPDADDALPPDDRRPGVRDAGRPVPRPGHPRGRHGRGAQRDPRHGRGVAERQGAPRAPGRGDRAHPPPVDGGARDVRGRALPDADRHDLRPPGRAHPDLHGRLGTDRREDGRPGGRRLHHHERQGPGALRPAPREGRGGGPRGRAGLRRDGQDDGDQGLLRPRRRVRPQGLRVVGGARPAGRRQERRGRPARDGAPGRRRAGPRAHPLHRHGRSAGVRGADPPLRRARLHPPGLPRPGDGPAPLHGPVLRRRAAAPAHGVRRAGRGPRV